METENLAHAQSASKRVIVFAPNWLGDAVMALPAIDDVRRHTPGASISVAARPSIAPLFALVPGIRGVVVVDRRGAGWLEGVRRLREGSFDAALLLPNSLQSALTAWRAGIPERWGYRAQGRAALLTRAVRAPVPRGHQALYYQRLTEALGFAPGPLEPHLDVPADARRAAADLLASAGWNRRSPLVALAPGAAYGGAKRWPAESFAALAMALAGDDVVSVLVGGAADAAAGADVMGTGRWREAPGRKTPIPLNLIGCTDLPMLAGVLAQCRALVSNDSGAMHFGAALGVPLVAIFGPTNERETRPIGRLEPVVLSHDVWCRPCMLRECPLTHRCMRGVTVETVLSATRRAS
jgi:lipopolysaccharide heptosyltransferase II